MKKFLLSILTLVIASALFAGCSQSKPAEEPKKEPAAEAPKTETPAPAPAPLSTEFKGKSSDGKLEVVVKVTNKVASVEMVSQGWKWNKSFASAKPENPVNAAGEGHAILTLDTAEPKYVGTMRSALSGLTAGKHTLKVQLVNNDNSPTGSEVSVEFEVK